MMTPMTEQSNTTSPWGPAFAAVGVLVSDDASVVGTADDIAIPVVMAAALTYDLTERTYLTYTLSGPNGKIYVGRTSGFGDPQSIIMRRYSGHHMALKGYGNPNLDEWSQGPLGYSAIRGSEQQLIDHYGGIGSPKVGNSIRGVG
jgi:hypothetical protein